MFITLLLITLVVGFVLFLVKRFAPIEGNIALLLTYVVIFALALLWVLFFLDLFGLYHFDLKGKLT